MRAKQKTWLMGMGWILLAALTAVMVTQWMLQRSGRESGHRHHGGSEQAFHDWMHQHLGLNAEQGRRLEPFELKFEAERQRLRGEIEAVGRELAAAVSAASAMTPESEALLRRLNEAQAQLQRAALQHFYEMKEHLNPAQQAKLSQWTHDSLLHQEGAHHE
jgi:nickel and cobalt resistance protein CnrR